MYHSPHGIEFLYPSPHRYFLRESFPASAASQSFSAAFSYIPSPLRSSSTRLIRTPTPFDSLSQATHPVESLTNKQQTRKACASVIRGILLPKLSVFSPRCRSNMRMHVVNALNVFSADWVGAFAMPGFAFFQRIQGYSVNVLIVLFAHNSVVYGCKPIPIATNAVKGGKLR